MIRGYVRVSTKQQGNGGISLQAQKKLIKQRAEENPVKFYRDIKSGRTNHRKALKKLLEDLRQGDTVIVYKMDRISRSMIDMLNLIKIFKKKKVKFISCAEAIDSNTASGRAFVRSLASWAQFESELIGERTKSALDFCRSEGRVLGAIPFGMDRLRNSKKLVENPGEQSTIKLMQRLRRTGPKVGLSYEKIAEYLDKHLIPSKNGRHWHGANVSRILQRNAAK